jgi:hypothetical protein
MLELPRWAEDFYSASEKNRTASFNASLESMKKLSGPVSALENLYRKNKAKIIGAVPYIIYYSTRDSSRHSLPCFMSFKSPVFAFKSPNLSCVIITGASTAYDNTCAANFLDKKADISQSLSWARLFADLKLSEKQSVINGTLNDMLESTKKEDRDLGVHLRDGEFDVIGSALNISYIRVNGPDKMQNTLWVHPWGGPTILAKHKKADIIIMARCGIMLNDSVLGRYKENNFNVSLLGITG